MQRRRKRLRNIKMSRREKEKKRRNSRRKIKGGRGG